MVMVAPGTGTTAWSTTRPRMPPVVAETSSVGASSDLAFWGAWLAQPAKAAPPTSRTARSRYCPRTPTRASRGPKRLAVGPLGQREGGGRGARRPRRGAGSGHRRDGGRAGRTALGQPGDGGRALGAGPRRGRRLRLLALHGVDALDEQEDGQGDDEEREDVVDELAVGDDGGAGGAGGLHGGGVGRRVALDDVEVVGVVDAAQQDADDGHEDVVDEGLDDGAEGGADDDADREVHHGPLHGELLELLPDLHGDRRGERAGGDGPCDRPRRGPSGEGALGFQWTEELGVAWRGRRFCGFTAIPGLHCPSHGRGRSRRSKTLHWPEGTGRSLRRVFRAGPLGPRHGRTRWRASGRGAGVASLSPRAAGAPPARPARRRAGGPQGPPG